MQVESSDELFDYYAYTISEVTDDIDYYYMALAGNVICYYNKLGTQKDLNPDYNFQIAPILGSEMGERCCVLSDFRGSFLQWRSVQ